MHSQTRPKNWGNGLLSNYCKDLNTLTFMPDDKIELLRKQQEGLLSKMDAIARDFIAATAEQLGAQVLPVSKRICQPQKEANKALSQVGLEQLVADVRVLASRMPAICHDCFYRETVWLHLNWPSAHCYKHDPRKSFPWAPGERGTNQTYGWSFIDAIDHLGLLLAASGFSTNTGSGYEGYQVNHSSLYREFTWSPDMERHHKRYDGLGGELWKAQRQIEEFTKNKPFQPTQEFWDSVQ